MPINTSHIFYHPKILSQDIGQVFFELYLAFNSSSMLLGLSWEGDVFSSVVFILCAAAAFHLLAAEGIQAVAILRGQT